MRDVTPNAVASALFVHQGAPTCHAAEGVTREINSRDGAPAFAGDGLEQIDHADSSWIAGSRSWFTVLQTEGRLWAGGRPAASVQTHCWRGQFSVSGTSLPRNWADSIFLPSPWAEPSSICRRRACHAWRDFGVDESARSRSFRS
jgi:hypothetical protein